MPKVLFAIKGDGPWRLENTDSTEIIKSAEFEKTGFYLSRIQKFCRWHMAVLWPLLIQGHLYFKKEYVPESEGINLDGKLIFCYRHYHRDEDEIYWGDGGFIGTKWK